MDKSQLGFSDIPTTLGDPSVEVRFREFKFKNYDVVRNSDNEWLLIGSEEENPQNPGVDFTFTKSKNTDVFDDLLTLCRDLEIPPDVRYPRSAINEYLNQSHFDRILKFCRKWGLPYCGSADEDAFFRGKRFDGFYRIDNLEILKSKYKYSVMRYGFFNISFFVYQLCWMFGDFQRYIANYAPNMVDSFEQYFKIDMKHFRKNAADFKDWPPSICRQFKFEYVLIHNGSKFNFEVQTYNLFHLAAYYFALICTGGEPGLNTQIKQCRSCGSYFLTSQSRRRYCSYCSRQNAWNKRNRNKMP